MVITAYFIPSLFLASHKYNQIRPTSNKGMPINYHNAASYPKLAKRRGKYKKLY